MKPDGICGVVFLVLAQPYLPTCSSCAFARGRDGVNPRLPMLFENVFPQSVLDHWTPSRIAREHGHEMVEVSPPTFVISSQGDALELMPLKTFVEQLGTKEDSELIVFDDQFIRRNSSLFRRELSAPGELVDLFRRQQSRGILSIGGPGSGLGFHSHPAAWLTLLHGEKLWLVYPPGRMPNNLHGAINSHGLDMNESRLSPNEQPLTCIQKPGQTVYLPAGYKHATLNHHTAVGVGFQAIGGEEFMAATSEALQFNSKDLDANLLLHESFSGSKPTLRRGYEEQFKDEVIALRAAQKLGQKHAGQTSVDIRGYIMLADKFRTRQMNEEAADELLSGLEAVEAAARKMHFSQLLHGHLLFRLAEPLLQLGHFEAALDSIQHAKQLLPASPSVDVALAIAYLELGENRNAQRYLRGLEHKLVFLPTKRRKQAEQLLHQLGQQTQRSKRDGEL